MRELKQGAGNNANRRIVDWKVAMAGGLLLLWGLCGCDFITKKEPAKAPPPPAVTVASPVVGPVCVYGEYVGVVDSPQTVELRARVEGFLKEIQFQEGAEVEKGALMFVIDPDVYQVALQKAEAQLQTAEAALLQAKNVKDIEVDQADVAKDEATLVNSAQIVKDTKISVAANASARELLDTAETNEKVARATLEADRAKLAQAKNDFDTRVAQAEAAVATSKADRDQAKLNLQYTRIYSPVKGRVGLASVKIGALVGHNGDATLLATVSLVDPVCVYFTVSERESFELHRLSEMKRHLGLLKGGTLVSAILEDGLLYAQQGKIDFVDRTLDSSTGTLNLRAEFPNPDRFLRPGNYAKVRAVLEERQSAILVSERAVSSDQGGPFVLVVGKDNIVVRHNVTIGPKENGLIVIESGLQADEKVVIKGLQKARPGKAVTPEEEEKSKPVAAVEKH
jgi:RND family efflux transporter MFP subunit